MPVFHGPVRKANFWVAIPIRDAKDTLVTSKRSAGKERTTRKSAHEAELVIVSQKVTL